MKTTIRNLPAAHWPSAEPVVRVTDQAPFAPTAESFTGRAFYRTAQRETRLGGKGIFAGQQRPGDRRRHGFVAIRHRPGRGTGPQQFRGPSDLRTDLQALTLSFDQQANIPVIRGGAGPVSDADLAGCLRRLSFALRWTGMRTST